MKRTIRFTIYSLPFVSFVLPGGIRKYTYLEASIYPLILACYERKSGEAAHFGYCIILLGHISDTKI